MKVRLRLTVRSMLWAVLVCGLITFIFTALCRAIEAAREAARSAACRGNLCALEVALLNYHEVYGHFPPAYVVDADGRPMHSWRVLLLEFMDQDLYASYRFSEPWDGPNNRKLASQVPSFYACPNAADGLRTHARWTSYVAVVGPETAFPGVQATKRADFGAGRGETIAIAEVANSGIAWTEPRDLDLKSMSFSLNDPSRPSISTFDRDGPGVVFIDGSNGRLSWDLPPKALRALLIRPGATN